ncbi:MAG: anion transporter [candidate division KSB1 bacterium]|nr:anion transporter [candidate division KSB1 bacterium]MDZ7365569.1 anion transporter [candidate division KSB1 bacterium]MDZ7403671.1 anion transporter [candidate division KSB1 bacterium]
MTNYLALVIFALTYLIIASQKIRYLHLDRPSGALSGAVLMVICGVMTLDEAYQAINFDTITLLLGTMILVGYLRYARFFRYVTYLLLSRLHTATQLLAGIIIAAGLLSAIFVNDTICLMMTPLVVQLCEETKLDLAPFLIALATASNIGSVMTLVGNPQNMLVGIYSGWSYGGFFLRMLPVGLLGLALDFALIYFFFKKSLIGKTWANTHLAAPRIDLRLMRKSLLVLAGAMIGFLFSPELALISICAGTAIILLARKPPARAFAYVDWALLLFFGGLFIVVAGVNQAGFVEKMFAPLKSFFGVSIWQQLGVFSAVSIFFSNLVSNVPFVLIAAQWVETFANPKLMWLALAMASTFAGNLTIVGSVANMIVMELSRDHLRVPFWTFFKIGAPLTLLSTAMGVVILGLYATLGI